MTRIERPDRTETYTPYRPDYRFPLRVGATWRDAYVYEGAQGSFERERDCRVEAGPMFPLMIAGVPEQVETLHVRCRDGGGDQVADVDIW